jgi:sRNA-binding regulator protein Hfq
MSNRKLIRPSLAEIKEQLTVRQPRAKRPAPNDQTNAENFYYVKQIQNKTPMVVVLQDGETIKGSIEWYDKNSIKMNRSPDPPLLLLKHYIKYMYKENERRTSINKLACAPLSGCCRISRSLEVVLKSIYSALSTARWVLFTDRPIFDRNLGRFYPQLQHRWIENLSDVSDDPVLYVFDLRGNVSGIQWTQPTPATGGRALAYLQAASAAALAGTLDAIVTAPVSKEAIGGDFRGQTDFLAERAGVEQYAMAFFAPTFKVVLATIHLSLREALAQISTEHYIRSSASFTQSRLNNRRGSD